MYNNVINDDIYTLLFPMMLQVGRTALINAARGGHLDVIRYLVEDCGGIDMDAKEDVSNFISFTFL